MNNRLSTYQAKQYEKTILFAINCWLNRFLKKRYGPRYVLWFGTLSMRHSESRPAAADNLRRPEYVPWEQKSSQAALGR